MNVEDYFTQGRRGWVRLHEKGGKEHEAPCHHKLEHTFRSLRREKIELRKRRAKETKHPLMERLQAQNQRLSTGTDRDMQEINAFKTLENPAHRGTIGWLVHLIGNGLLRCGQLSTQQMLSKSIDQ